MGTASTSGRSRHGCDRRLAYGALAAVTLIGLGLRWSYLDEPIRVDEGKIAAWVQAWTFGEVASSYENVGNHVLHTLAVELCHALFGLQPWSIRLPALLPGVALIPVTWLAAAALFSRGTALVAAGLVAGAPYLTYYSVISRGYLLQSVLLMALAWLLLRRAEFASRRLTLAAGAAGALALYTVPSALFVLPGLYAGAAAWAAGRGANPSAARRAAVRGWAGRAGRLLPALAVTAGLTLLLYLPVFLATDWERIAVNQYTAVQQGALLWERLVARLAGTASKWSFDLPFPAPAACAVLAGAGLLAAVRRGQGASALLIVLTIASTVAFSVLLRRVPPVRGYLPLMPFFLMLPAAGIDAGLRAVLRRLPARRAPAAHRRPADGRSPATGAAAARVTRVPDAAARPETEVACALLAVALAAAGALWTWSGGWLETERGVLRGRYAGAESAMLALAEVVGERDTVLSAAPAWPYRYYVALHSLPVRFADARYGGRPEDVVTDKTAADHVYVLIPDGDDVPGALAEYGLLEGFGEPRPFGVFGDIRVVVVANERRQSERGADGP